MMSMSGQTGQTASAITKSTSFWFDDGNLVLEVENTQFRVHNSILALHSSFFKDLFLLPQPVEPTETLENGTRIIQMPCDRQEEWSRMLHVIYIPLQSHESYKEYSPLTILAMLRLGHKYQFQRLEDLARAYIKDALPLTFDSWLDRSQLALKTGNDSGPFDGHEYTLLKIVREVGMLSVLPVVHLMCIWKTNNVQALFDMLQKENKGKDSQLEWTDLQALTGGRELYLQVSVSTWYTMVTSDATYGNCGSIWHCKLAVTDLLKEAFARGANTTPKVSILGGLILGKTLPHHSELCDRCRSLLADEEYSAGEEIWENLHSYFGLEAPALTQD